MIVVTGGSGFVGRRLTLRLSERFPGEPLRIFDQRPPPGPLPERTAFWKGSVVDSEDVKAALEGAERVVHLAANVNPAGTDDALMRKVNVDGTRNAHAAAVATGCDLFVHLSSAGVYGRPRGPEPFRETDTPRPRSPYQRSKWEGERILLDAVCDGTSLVVLRPAGIYGPGSRLELPDYRRIRAQHRVVELEGGVVVHPTFVDDVVDGIIAVLENPPDSGSVFNIGGERPILLQDLQALVADIMGVRRRRLVVPRWIAGPIARLAAPLLSAVGRPKPDLPAMARGERLSAAVDDRRFRKRYDDVAVTDLREGLERHIEWAMAEGLLQASG